MSSHIPWTQLGEPRPWPEPAAHTPYGWPAGRQQVLDRVDSLREMNLVDLAIRRRSCRKFKRAASDEALGHLLFLSCFAHATKEGPHGYTLTQTCAPSAGAIHGVHVLVLRPSQPMLWHYDSMTHALVEVDATETVARHATSRACSTVDVSKAALLLFVAEPGKYATKYDACDSLIWRDAGVLLGTMSLIAEGLDLDFCPLGVTGESAVRLLDQELRLAGVGMAALGSR